MTQETRETLEQMYAYAASRAEWHPSLMDITDPGWDEDDLVECVEASARWGHRALALRDVLTPRTCGTCQHWHRGGRNGVYPLSCEIRPGEWRSNDGCIKGWQAREGEGGDR